MCIRLGRRRVEETSKRQRNLRRYTCVLSSTCSYVLGTSRGCVELMKYPCRFKRVTKRQRLSREALLTPTLNPLFQAHHTTRLVVVPKQKWDNRAWRLQERPFSLRYTRKHIVVEFAECCRSTVHYMSLHPIPSSSQHSAVTTLTVTFINPRVFGRTNREIKIRIFLGRKLNFTILKIKKNSNSCSSNTFVRKINLFVFNYFEKISFLKYFQ